MWEKTTKAVLKAMFLRISMLVRRKEEENKKDGLAKSKGRCEVCGTVVECLAEFNRKQMCAKCLELMIQIRVRGRGETSTIEDIPETRQSALKEEEILLQA